MYVFSLFFQVRFFPLFLCGFLLIQIFIFPIRKPKKQHKRIDNHSIYEAMEHQPF